MAASMSDDHAYYLKRSEDHRGMADRSTVASSRIAHLQFADAYARRADQVLVQED
ncbi:hypothetical protein [Sphingomonas sp. Leaf33]|uniref:hypothetical protein n=1 Tax=Sphingomonas sp. Leaf33 TaxID=1736215 RepID=UPI000B1D81E5|nr:hypothetical protein [Sphingomonas sp. Leaf33]